MLLFWHSAKDKEWSKQRVFVSNYVGLTSALATVIAIVTIVAVVVRTTLNRIARTHAVATLIQEPFARTRSSAALT